jgi:uncharacterized protein
VTRVVVLADTHMHRRGRSLPQELASELERADLAIHLGDFTDMQAVHLIESYTRLEAVSGNNDSPDVRDQFPAHRMLNIGPFRLALIHGHEGGRTALQAARAISDADAVLFGHSHRAHISQQNGRLLFNPGSPTDPRWSGARSYGILEIGTRIQPSIVQI